MVISVAAAAAADHMYAMWQVLYTLYENLPIDSLYENISIDSSNNRRHAC